MKLSEILIFITILLYLLVMQAVEAFTASYDNPNKMLILILCSVLFLAIVAILIILKEKLCSHENTENKHVEWFRRDMPKETNSCYFEYLLGKKISTVLSSEQQEFIKKALVEAHEIRRFEINLFWKRAQFFWIFIGVIFAAYGTIILPIINDSKELPITTPQYVLLTILNIIGITITYIWHKVIESSKYWQENWEFHIDKLEEYVTGHLHKVMYKSETQILSVSKLCKLLAYGCFVLWGLSHFACTYFLYNVNSFKWCLLLIYTSAILLLIVYINLFTKSTSVR